MPFGLTVTS
ncbi:hypothetical protein D018_3847A, partial [Vibrio parahaemolyticus VP2007-007]